MFFSAFNEMLKSLSFPITGYYWKQNIVDFQLWTVMVNWYVNHPLSFFFYLVLLLSARH